jgi:hemin uptake protein HemP
MHAIGTSSTLNIPNTPMPAPAGTRAPAYVDLDSRRLFNGTQEVRIHHDGQEYRLRQTRNGKLILTK